MNIKKIAVIAIAIAALAGCCKRIEDNKAWSQHGRDCYTKVIEIEGHKYIIMDGSYSGNIIHAASCQCMSK